jgi:hypothetical protein
MKAAERLQAEKGVNAEVIGLRSLVPLDLETILCSVRKTGRCVVASQAIHIGSYTGEIASTIQDAVFDYLDVPVKRVGARNGIAPQSHILEAAFLPGVNDILAAANEILESRGHTHQHAQIRSNDRGKRHRREPGLPGPQATARNPDRSGRRIHRVRTGVPGSRPRSQSHPD